jgi:phenylpropionate dioxygenase-like ring-hydroxylating dioxygenase large terminal subunit
VFPTAPNFFDLDIKKCGLTPIACDVWEGWIFINLQKVPEVSLKEFLGPFGEAFANAPAPSAEHAFNVNVSTMKANWKTTIDAFCESYHVPVLQPGHGGRDLRQRQQSVLASAQRPRARRASHDDHVRQPGLRPARARPGWSVSRTATSTSANTLGANDAKEIQALLDHPAINPRRVPNWATEIAWIFPNFLIFYSPGGFFTLEFWPLSVNSTRWVARMHIPKAKDVRQRFPARSTTTAAWQKIFLEDVGNLERQQRAMESGAKTEIILQDGEFMLRHSIQTIRKWVAAKTVREALA